MIYTQQRRRNMNKEVRNMYPNIQFYESSGSIPVMECNKLPEGAGLVTDEESFTQQVKNYCCRTNEMGTQLADNSLAYPVFILSKKLNGSKTSYYYRVNYVTYSDASLKAAYKYITDKVLYTVPVQHTSNP